LFFSRQKNLSLKLLAACNSGDTAGGKDRVVGYSAFGLYEGGEVSLDEAGRTLLSLARGSIETNLLGKPEPTTAASWLSQSGATFVTLTKEDNLRGCIGSLEAARALAEDVVQNALGAAFRDPRFPAMTAAEWSQCRVEVSLLSTPKPVRFADEANLLEQIEAGEDGLIVEADGRRATFLPQVWEDIGDKRVFLSHLLRKAGLPADTRLARCKISRYRVAKWKE
jgi:AmmeMemoRadiSam system protein A